MNLQPSEAEAGFDIRVPPTADPQSLEKRIAEEWAPAARNMTFEVESPETLTFLREVVNNPSVERGATSYSLLFYSFLLFL